MSAADDAEYLTALGQAVFSYALLEYRVIWILEKLSPGYLNTYRTSFRTTASKLAGDLKAQSVSLAATKPHLAGQLASLHSEFVKLGRQRNDLLHANPASSASGDQILIRQHFQKYVIWDIKTVREATTAFGALEAIGAGLFDAIP
ncbi:MAG: hypothetical protein WAV72_14065 [Bradyrhizobium sp.]